MNIKNKNKNINLIILNFIIPFYLVIITLF